MTRNSLEIQNVGTDLVNGREKLTGDIFTFHTLFARVAEVAREHRWHTPKSLDSDKNFKPERYFVAN